MLNKVEMNKIAMKYSCWINSVDRIYHVADEVKLLGKVYWKDTTGYYHAINANDKRYEGQKNFEVLLVNFLKGEKIITQ